MGGRETELVRSRYNGDFLNSPEWVGARNPIPRNVE